MVKLAIGLVIAFGIGAGARWFAIPVPSPPKIFGAILILAMTLGYVTVDHLVKRQISTSTTESKNTSAPTQD